MLDRAFRAAFRNFSTLFLVVAAVTVPLHLVYSFAFRNVIETRELHPAIRQFPDYRQVRRVGPPQLTQAQIAFWGLTAIEIAMIPLAIRATRRVIQLDDEGEVPTVPDAWAHARSRATTTDGGPGRPRAPEIAVAALVAVAVGIMIERSVLVVVGFFPETYAWVLVGLGQAFSRAAGVPFLLTPFAVARRAKAEAPFEPKLY